MKPKYTVTTAHTKTTFATEDEANAFAKALSEKNEHGPAIKKVVVAHS